MDREVENWATPLSQCPRNLLSDDKRVEYLNYGLLLYTAALKGNWEDASQIHSRYRYCFASKITRQGDTALHIAAVFRRTDFAVQLVNLMVQDECTHLLHLRNDNGNTALCLAAASGTVEIAKAMVVADEDLLRIPGNNSGMTPLHMAALLGHRDMVNYLLPLTQLRISDQERNTIFISLINSDLYDVALKMVSSHRQLVMARDGPTGETPSPVHGEIPSPVHGETPSPVHGEIPSPVLGETPLHVLAKKILKARATTRLSKCCNIFKIGGRWSLHDEVPEQHMALELLEYLLKLLLQKTQDEIEKLIEKPWEVIFIAVEVGNVEFVITLLRTFPDLMWKFNDKNQSIFHVAVIHRQEKIFQLIYEIGAMKELLLFYLEKDTDNNILHLAAMLPSSDRLNSISGAALQMQREMYWFKVVEDLVMPHHAEHQNREGKTPFVLFTEHHKELRKSGEKWMRNMASSCSVVATLIASAIFGSLLKVPRTIADSLSNPLHYSGWYLVFAITDTLSLIASTASTLVFLSMLTSRYAEKDFLHSLPRKLLLGLLLLFLSIIFITFTTTFHIVYNHGWPWFGITVVAMIAILLFTRHELSLMREVFRSTMKSSGYNFESPTPILF